MLVRTINGLPYSENLLRACATGSVDYEVVFIREAAAAAVQEAVKKEKEAKRLDAKTTAQKNADSEVQAAAVAVQKTIKEPEAKKPVARTTVQKNSDSEVPKDRAYKNH